MSEPQSREGNGGRHQKALALYNRRGQPRTKVVPPLLPGTYPYNNPGWVGPAPRPSEGQKVVYWRCYATDAHFANAGTADLHERADWVMANFEGLVAEQKARIP